MKKSILVIGGTGKTGRKVVNGLNQLGHKVRIGSRAATPIFDWHQPETWHAALDKIDAVYITFQPDLAVPGALEAIEGLVKAAKKQQVKKLVLLSGKGEREAELCEQVVIHSGLDYTVIRCSWFNQNFSESFFLDAIKTGYVGLPKQEAKVPYVDTDDIAAVAIKALLEAEHNGQIYQLTGPDTLSFPEVIDQIAEATGREIIFTPISQTAYISMLSDHGVPADYVWLINYLFTEVLGLEGNNVVTQDVKKVLGREAKSFSDYVRETAKTGVWNAPVATENH